MAVSSTRLDAEQTRCFAWRGIRGRKSVWTRHVANLFGGALTVAGLALDA